MARLGIIFGLVLCGMTVVGLVQSVDKNPYQFVPMILGIPILFCGVVALNPHRRKHAMHVSATIAALGTFVAGMRTLSLTVRWFNGDSLDRFGFEMVFSLSVSCLVFLLICIASFWNARRRIRNETDEISTVGERKASPNAEKSELEPSAVGRD